MLPPLLKRLRRSLLTFNLLPSGSGPRRNRPPLRLRALETRDLPAGLPVMGPIAPESNFVRADQTVRFVVLTFTPNVFTSTSNAVATQIFSVNNQVELHRDASPQPNQPSNDMSRLMDALRQTPGSASNSQASSAGAAQSSALAAYLNALSGTQYGLRASGYFDSANGNPSGLAFTSSSGIPTSSVTPATAPPASTPTESGSTGTAIERGPASAPSPASSGSVNPTTPPAPSTQPSSPSSPASSESASQTPTQVAVAKESATARAADLPAVRPITQLQNIKPTAPSADVVSGAAAATTVAGQLPSVAPVNSAATAASTNGTCKSASNGAANAAPSDGTLLAQFVRGDQAAFRQLVQRYSNLVNTTCRRVLGQSDRVGDAIQATFFALARRAADLDSRNGLGGWLRRVACRMALRCRSSDRRQREVEQLAARAPTSDHAFASVDARDTEEVVREELDRLPDMYRVPLILCYLNGFTHAEVANEIGIPRGSVAKRLNDGLILLREVLTVRGVRL